MLRHGLIGLAVCGAVCAQSDAEVAERLFKQRFVAAVRLAHAVGGDRSEAWRGLDAAELLIEELPEDKRAAARLGVAVRRAEVRLLEGRDREATERLLEARDAARSADAWGGSYRELACILLWQVAPHAYEEVAGEERDFLAAAELEAEVVERRAPLALLRLSRALGARETARAAERELAELADELGDSPWRIKALQVLVWHFLLQRDLARAERYAAKLPDGLAAYPRALIALRRGDFSTALGAGHALAAEDSRYECLVGDALEGLGDFEGMRAAYERALAGELDPVSRVVALRGLGDCALAEGRVADARAGYEAAVALADGVVEQRLVGAERFQLTVALGRVAEAEGDAAAALALHLRAIEEVSVLRARTAGDVFGTTLLTIDDLDAVEGVLRTFEGAGAAAWVALAAIETAKARILLDWIEVPPREDAADALADAVHALAVSPHGSIGERLAELERRRVGSAAEVTGPQARPLDAAAVAAHAAAWPEHVFLSYWLGPARCSVAWALDDGAGVVDLGSRREALEVLGSARAAVVGADADPAGALTRAATWFVPPEVRAHIDAAARVVFVPDEELGGLPFEALPFDSEPLGVARPVERAPSLSVRVRLAERAAVGRGALVVHAVDGAADLERAFELPPLAFSAREGELVGRAHEHAVVISGSSATLAAVAEQLRAAPFDVVHVSAHAVAAPTSPVLVLADGAASLPALVDMPLRGALLVLSACSSALGEARRGEGEIGLLGWPLAAGARGAIAALWPVNQQATSDLMAQFHAFLTDGHDAVEAMRRARGVLAAAPNYAHPHYWAGFGVFEPARERGSSTWLVGIAIGALVLVGVVVARRRVAT